MKKLGLSIVICAMVLFTSCRSTKSIQSATKSSEIEVPLSEKRYKSDKEFFRTTQSGTSPELSTAKKIAMQNAKTDLAGNIQSTLKNVTDQYTNQRSIAGTQDYENKFEELSRSVVNQELNDVKVIGEEVYKAKTGKYTYYIAIEVSRASVEKNVADAAIANEKLKLDFDKAQFQTIFDEEMAKTANK